MKQELCAGGCGYQAVRKWRNGKRYCNRCLEEIDAITKEAK